MEKKVFRSRISVLMMVFILAIVSLPLIPMISSGNIFYPVFYIIAGVIVFIVLLVSGFRYVITDGQLRVSTWGTRTWTCPLSKIVSVERSYNPLSAPAASLKRLLVRFEKGYKYPFTLISPVREKEFLETLKKHNPDIYIRVPDKKGWWRFWDWDI